MTSAYLSPLANHLWQSTLCVTAAWLLTLLLRRNRAALRYSVWLGASIKFLIPFSLLARVGARFNWQTAPAIAPSQWNYVVGQIGGPFGATESAATHTIATPTAHIGPDILLGIWLCGFGASLALWLFKWQKVRAASRKALPLSTELPIPAMSSPAQLEPGIFGIFRPVLLLPEGITDRLTANQFDAIVAHEMCHLRRRDNLTAAIHMLVEALFWFHPLVWWMGIRMVDERERACDESVVQSGANPEAYAEGIVSVCKFCIASPLACVSGVTGSNLKRRIVRILSEPLANRLGIGKKLLLAGLAIAAIAGPVVFGLINAPEISAAAQNQTAAIDVPTVSEVSIKPASPDDRMVHFGLMPNSRFTASGFTLKMLIQEAYGVEPDQVSGGPDWMGSRKFELEAKLTPSETSTAPKPTLNQAEALNQQMLRPILADRFKLVLHHETRYQPVYVLGVLEGGSKLHEATANESYPNGVKRPDGQPASAPVVEMRPGELIGQGLPIELVAHVLSQQLGHMVLDRTGLKADYDFTLKWTPDQNAPFMGFDGKPIDPPSDAPVADPTAPSIFTAVQEQLGLKLEKQTAPVDVIVVDSAEEPSPN